MTPEIDETLLTAYALGELDARERARVAAHVEADAEARRYVDDVREAATAVAGELSREPVEGLLAIQREMIERRLREADARRLRSGSGRMRRWLPLAASLAASIVIVGGIAAVLLPKFRQPTQPNGHVVDSSTGRGITVVGPQDTVESPTLPDASNDPATADVDRSSEFAHGGDADDPVEGMRDPGEFLPERGTPLKDRPAAPSKQPAPKPAVAAKDKEPQLADGRGPAHSPEAEDVRAKKDRAAKPAPAPTKGKSGKGTVNVSPPRDPKAFDQIKNKAAAAAELARVYENPFRSAKDRPRSAFPVRVERWSYVTVRTNLLENKMPPRARVRIEELVNHFAYTYPSPTQDGPPLAVTVEVATCPWDVNHRLARVAVKARDGGATVVAKAVEAAVEFNRETTAKWRLIGYENSPAASQPKTFPFDLNAGGAATAFYEIVPTAGREARASSPKDLFTVTVRYQEPGNESRGAQTLTCPATDAGAGFDRASEDFRFATSVAAFGMLLRDSQFKGSATYADVIRWATAGKGADATKERQGLIDLVKVARDVTR